MTGNCSAARSIVFAPPVEIFLSSGPYCAPAMTANGVPFSVHTTNAPGAMMLDQVRSDTCPPPPCNRHDATAPTSRIGRNSDHDPVGDLLDFVICSPQFKSMPTGADSPALYAH